jgi:hypothetical protein
MGGVYLMVAEFHSEILKKTVMTEEAFPQQLVPSGGESSGIARDGLPCCRCRNPKTMTPAPSYFTAQETNYISAQRRSRL